MEDALYSHPAVQECAVIGIPSDQWGEAVHAVVVKAGQEISEADLIAHCKALAGFKVPRSLSFSEDELPKSGRAKSSRPIFARPSGPARPRGELGALAVRLRGVLWARALAFAVGARFRGCARGC